MMTESFQSSGSAQSWLLSQLSGVQVAALQASPDIFAEARIDRILKKCNELTGYLYLLLQQIRAKKPNAFTIVTPQDPSQRNPLDLGLCRLPLDQGTPDRAGNNSRLPHAEHHPDCARTALQLTPRRFPVRQCPREATLILFVHPMNMFLYIYICTL